MLEFVVVAEAEADARLVCDLADRIFLEEGPNWVYEELLPNLRNWSGFDDPTYTRWPAIKLIRQELGFDPCKEAHRLRYSSRTSRPERDPKRILGSLTDQNSEREERCWKETALATLQERGEQTYLKEFLAEVKDRLLPLLSK